MKVSEFRRFLAAQGVEFVEGAKHTKMYMNGKQATLPGHGSQEAGEGLRRAILRQLGIRHQRWNIFSHPARVTRDGDGYMVSFPDIPEASTGARARSEAVELAADASTTAMDFYFEDR